MNLTLGNKEVAKMTMQPDPSGPRREKRGPLHFEKVDFSTIKKIDNSSILEMMKYDVHLLDTPRICPTALKSRFNEIITRYITAEKQRKEQEMENCLSQLSNLFLGSTRNDDSKGYELMDLHLKVQRFLRNPVYRSHAVHLLGVCLFSNLLMETDIDLLTLGRTEKYFYPALKHFRVPKGRYGQNESEHNYYPRGDRSKMHRGFYPAGELFAVKLRNYLKEKKQHALKDAVCYFFDPFIWLNLYHDWGYIYELEESYSNKIFKKGKLPDGIEPIIEGLDDRKNKINFDLDYYSKNITNLKKALEKILVLPICADSSKNRKVKELRKLSKRMLYKEKNHGVVSSLILYDKFLKKFECAKVAKAVPHHLKKYKRDFLIDELGAICLHDLDLYEKAGVRLRLTDSPHYFLLKFADVVSDWGRIYKGKKSLFDFPTLEHILFGFNPVECTTPNGDRYEAGGYGILVNIIFDFSNNKRLLAGEIGARSKGKDRYPRRDNPEFEQFVKKSAELQCLDYLVGTEGEEHQWFFFNLVLIDRYGERFLIENSKNSVDLWWVVPPLFGIKYKKLKNKEFSRLVNYKKLEFKHES